MKKVFFTIFALLLISSVALAQWTYVEDFKTGPRPHGVVVDADGKIWIGYYAWTDTIGLPTDTIAVTPIYVYNADGTEAARVTFVTVDGVTDTLQTYCRGLSLDHNGNILFVGNRVLYRINYQTYEGMNKYTYPYASGSLTSAGSDENGYVYLTKVVPGGNPLVILDEDFELYGFVLDSCFTIQRAVIVTPDGKDVYVGRIYGGGSGNGVLHYHSDDGPDGEYVAVDTVWKQIWGQCVDWDNNGLLWVGSYWDIGDDDIGDWYALDPTQDFAIVDTIGHNAGADISGVPAGGSYHSPRHIAFSADGKTAYTGDFDGGSFKKWTNANPAQPGDPPILPTSVRDMVLKSIPVDFELFQNYPNPFNPTTTIPFSLEKQGFVELKVYDLMGREVKTLISEPRMVGSYKVNFDGTGLASGIYYYRLTFDGKLKSKQMILLQ